MSLVIVKPDGSSLTFDATISEDPNPEVLATDHPVEDGSEVTDHVQRLPVPFSCEVLVTESPFDTSTAANPKSTGPERVQIALDFLDSCVGEKLLIQTTRRGLLRDMLLLRWPAPITSRKDARFSLTFKPIRTATAALAQVAPRPAKRIEATTAAAENAGTQAPAVGTPDPDTGSTAYNVSGYRASR